MARGASEALKALAQRVAPLPIKPERLASPGRARGSPRRYKRSTCAA